MIIFVKLLLAHLIGDFLLQPTSWVEDKEKNKQKSLYLYLHTFLHGAIAWILVGEKAFFGFAVGDALGVPVEFKSRDYLKNAPVEEMIGYGTWNQPPGTWSDDSSLAFCLAESCRLIADSCFYI